jgi:hypothetical protein
MSVKSCSRKCCAGHARIRTLQQGLTRQHGVKLAADHIERGIFERQSRCIRLLPGNVLVVTLALRRDREHGFVEVGCDIMDAAGKCSSHGAGFGVCLRPQSPRTCLGRVNDACSARRVSICCDSYLRISRNGTLTGHIHSETLPRERFFGRNSLAFSDR